MSVRPRKHYSKPLGQRSRSRLTVGKRQGYIASHRRSHVNRRESQGHRSEFKVKGRGEGQTSEIDAVVLDLNYIKFTDRGQGQDSECDRMAWHVILKALKRWNVNLCT